MIKIGNWIFDEQENRIIGSGPRTYLLSRNEYGTMPFEIRATLEFSNFRAPPQGSRIGMNAGILFGWKSEREINRYYNILLTGRELLVERVGFKGGREGQDFDHITNPVPLSVESKMTYDFEVRVSADHIEIDVNGKDVLSLARPTGVVGRVGLRPWRSQIDCTQFVVKSLIDAS